MIEAWQNSLATGEEASRVLSRGKKRDVGGRKDRIRARSAGEQVSFFLEENLKSPPQVADSGDSHRGLPFDRWPLNFH